MATLSALGAAAAQPLPPARLPSTASDLPPAAAESVADAAPQDPRTRLNAQILQASLEVSLKAGDDASALLYRSAIDRINELLAPEFGPGALQAVSAQDHSPAATAGRIVALSTAFFDRYAAQHAGEDPEAVVRNFMKLIRSGFEQGYGEAREILSGLGVMDEGSTIADAVQQTYALVQQGYDDFLAHRLAALGGEAAASGAAQDSGQR
ncbi:DUF5610 domain-containing protein [Comamonas sp. NLF-1-9]|uniref:DUF5610 domain-containing protein n=1 Tax=Comamonas sp. NLF-1-9 TaxID=2853163 RepID=UPI001C4447E8|nr:DUF5610 domain-containing protein [Comamonas sp. NLF-1-9]QXL84817.1 DUF5610 domain-containing protein [Comamonas sp. NLF-1-9]